MRRITDQAGRPAGQRKLGAGAGKRFLVLFRLIKQDHKLVKKKVKVMFDHFKNYNQYSPPPLFSFTTK